MVEVFSPPRVTQICGAYGPAAGEAFDLKSVDPDDGKPWDLHNSAKKKKVLKIIREKRPWLLIGSPCCAAFSVLQNLTKGKGDLEKKAKLRRQAVAPLEFVCEIYKLQVEQGRYFLHEHPLSATYGKRHALLM